MNKEYGSYLMTLTTDGYSYFARVLPAYIVVLPIILVLTYGPLLNIVLPVEYIVLVFLPCAFLAGEVSAFWGRRIEKRFLKKWNGLPTTRFLRHSNNEINKITQKRWHKKICDLGFSIPTIDDEIQNQKKADKYWASCVQMLIAKTRDRNRFPLVYAALIEYGFSRNLLGCKGVGLLSSLIVLALCLFEIWIGGGNIKANFTLVGTSVFSGLLAAVWIFWVNEDKVKASSNRYAKALLESLEELK